MRSARDVPGTPMPSWKALERAGRVGHDGVRARRHRQLTVTGLGRRIEIRGIVQGVGFRPWVYRLATEQGVAGHVRNDAAGVTIEAFGPEEALDAFVAPARDVGAAGRRRSASCARRRFRLQSIDTFSIVQSAERHRAARLHSARSCHLCRMPVGDLRSGGPALPLSVHQLHELRAALHDRARRAVRPAGDDDGGVPDVRRPASASTTMSATGDSTRSRTPVRSAARGWRCVRPDGTRRRRRRSDRRRGRRARRRGVIVAIKGLGGFHLACDATSPDAVATAARAQAARREAVRRHGRDLAEAERAGRR